MSAERAASRGADGQIEAGLLALIFELHPEHLGAEELLRRASTAAPHLGDPEDFERALRRLRRNELVRQTHGRIIPTRAALHFHGLPF